MTAPVIPFFHPGPEARNPSKQKADGEGFEPPGPFQARLFSKQVL